MYADQNAEAVGNENSTATFEKENGLDVNTVLDSTQKEEILHAGENVYATIVKAGAYSDKV
jgi:hypothetical protein